MALNLCNHDYKFGFLFEKSRALLFPSQLWDTHVHMRTLLGLGGATPGLIPRASKLILSIGFSQVLRFTLPKLDHISSLSVGSQHAIFRNSLAGETLWDLRAIIL